MLTESNVDALLEDMRTGLLDGEGDYIALIGVEPGTAQYIRDDTELQAALHDFSAHERGPVHIVVVQLGDAYVDYLFVPHNPSEATVNLLDAWGLFDPNIRVKMRRYRKLHTARLESLYDLSSKAE